MNRIITESGMPFIADNTFHVEKSIEQQLVADNRLLKGTGIIQ